ncbi:MAG: hypothetical protein AB8F74_05615 [Saprospiraceae bacterium]
MNLQKVYIVVGLCFSINCISAQGSQDTIRYEGLAGIMFYESIELYPNSYFKWTLEYDLTWSEFGIYEIKDEKLILKYYDVLNESNKTLLSGKIEFPDKTEFFKVKENQIYRLNKWGRKIKRIRDRSFSYKMSWLFGHKYRFLKA